MRSWSRRWFSGALAISVLFSVAAQAQVLPFRGYFGPGLSPEDNQMLLESVARLNAAEPSKVGRRRTAAGSRLPPHLVPNAEAGSGRSRVDPPQGALVSAATQQMNARGKDPPSATAVCRHSWPR
jgi:hypothetical protein